MANQEVCIVMEPRRASILVDQTSSKKGPTSAVLLMKRFLRKWEQIFLVSCLLSIVFDAFFFYIPYTVEENKCFKLDQRLKTLALVVRAVLDLFYLVDIFCLLQKAGMFGVSNSANEDVLAKLKRMPWGCIVNDIVAVIPIPQVAIIIFFPKLRSTTSTYPIRNVWPILKFFVVAQYVTRIWRIYLLWKEFDIKFSIFAEVALSLYKVLLASHVLGAFWYFTAIQQEISCWRNACKSKNGCGSSTFSCDDHAFPNVTLLNELCPVNPPDTSLFDFGIYLNALRFGRLKTNGSTNLLQRLMYCMWWGLQNIGTLGQKFQTSVDFWENVFAFAIFFLGLGIFSVFVNDAMQIRNQLSMKHRELMEGKHLEVQVWLSKNSLPKNLKRAITPKIQKLVTEKRAVNLETILSIVPWRVANDIKYHLCFATVNNNVSLLCEVLPITWDIPELKVICEKLKPMIYTENTCIIQEGKTLDRVLFFMQGTISISKPNSANANEQEISVGKGAGKRDYHNIGEEVVRWASDFTFSPSTLPTSPETIKSITEVEAFALTASDLKSVCFNLWMHFSKTILHPTDDQYNHLQSAAANSSLRAPLLAWLDKARASRKLRAKT